MLETLLVITLSFSGGFATRYFTEPEKVCKEIKIDVPERFFVEHETTDCPEYADKITGIIQECPFPAEEKIWKVPDDEYKDLSAYIKEMRLHLKMCNDIILEYNEDKFIIKD